MRSPVIMLMFDLTPPSSCADVLAVLVTEFCRAVASGINACWSFSTLPDSSNSVFTDKFGYRWLRCRCWALAAAAVDRHFPPEWCSVANPPHTAVAWWDRPSRLKKLESAWACIAYIARSVTSGWPSYYSNCGRVTCQVCVKISAQILLLPYSCVRVCMCRKSYWTNGPPARRICVVFVWLSDVFTTATSKATACHRNSFWCIQFT